MLQESILRVRSIAGDNFRQGFNCAESVFLAFRDVYHLDVDKNLMRIMTGFGGGIGEHGCLCGALSGSIAVIGLLRGRTSAEEDRLSTYKLSRAFSESFESEFGATCCRVIQQPYAHDTKQTAKHCLKVTGNTAQLLMVFLINNNILPNRE